MAASIPASAIVQVVPNVIGAGGSGLDLVGLILTNSTRVPVGAPLRFASATDVSTYFGPLSTEATLATIYFAGYDGSIITPASLLFYQYASTAVPAYLRGGNPNLTLAQLQALPAGTISLTVDGRAVTSASISLAAASSFSNAAALIQTGLADQDASFTGTISGTALTVTSPTGTIRAGQTVTGAGVTAGTTIVSGSGTSWVVSVSQTVGSVAMKSGVTTVTYDSVSGGFIVTAGSPGAVGTITFATTSALATSLALTAATGAVLSQGADLSVPGTAMDAVIAQTQDFVSFMTSFKPSSADMLAFAAWTDGKSDRYLYSMWDNDTAATTSSDTSSVGYQTRQLGYSGTAPIYDPANGASVAAFLMGAVASIDFTRPEGRITTAFRSGSGLLAGVTNQTIAANLQANGYNSYNSYATANDGFVFFYPGQVSGAFDWIDSYVNQIWMNNGFQLALMTLVTSVGSIPYNNDGYALIEAALFDQIDQAVSFGAVRAGVPLTALQAAQVNAAAGRIVSDTIEQRGWYALCLPASAGVRAARQSPPVYFFYTDGGSVQRIVLSSVLVQ